MCFQYWVFLSCLGYVVVLLSQGIEEKIVCSGSVTVSLEFCAGERIGLFVCYSDHFIEISSVPAVLLVNVLALFL